MIERFRKWFAFEKHAFGQAVAMLESVPEERRTDATYAKAMSKLIHLAMARKIWLHRMGLGDKPDAMFPVVASTAEISAAWDEVAPRWDAYLASLTDSDLAKSFEYTGLDGKRYRWQIEGVLTQTFGHAWYHRGQVGMIVAGLGGKFVDTDYVLWPEAGREVLAAN
jgi:uncharacterized damage-inducible protein DinB